MMSEIFQFHLETTAALLGVQLSPIVVGRDGSQLRLEVVGPRGSAGGSASTPDHPRRPEGRLQQLVITTGQDSNWLVALAESVVATDDDGGVIAYPQGSLRTQITPQTAALAMVAYQVAAQAVARQRCVRPGHLQHPAATMEALAAALWSPLLWAIQGAAQHGTAQQGMPQQGAAFQPLVRPSVAAVMAAIAARHAATATLVRLLITAPPMIGCADCAVEGEAAAATTAAAATDIRSLVALLHRLGLLQPAAAAGGISAAAVQRPRSGSSRGSRQAGSRQQQQRQEQLVVQVTLAVKVLLVHVGALQQHPAAAAAAAAAGCRIARTAVAGRQEPADVQAAAAAAVAATASRVQESEAEALAAAASPEQQQELQSCWAEHLAQSLQMFCGMNVSQLVVAAEALQPAPAAAARRVADRVQTAAVTHIGVCSICGGGPQPSRPLISCSCCLHEYHLLCAQQLKPFAPDIQQLQGSISISSSSSTKRLCVGCQGFPMRPQEWQRWVQAAEAAAAGVRSRHCEQQRPQPTGESGSQPGSAGGAAAAAADGSALGDGTGCQAYAEAVQRVRSAAAGTAAAAAAAAAAMEPESARGRSICRLQILARVPTQQKQQKLLDVVTQHPADELVIQSSCAMEREDDTAPAAAAEAASAGHGAAAVAAAAAAGCWSGSRHCSGRKRQADSAMDEAGNGKAAAGTVDGRAPAGANKRRRASLQQQQQQQQQQQPPQLASKQQVKPQGRQGPQAAAAADEPCSPDAATGAAGGRDRESECDTESPAAAAAAAAAAAGHARGEGVTTPVTASVRSTPRSGGGSCSASDSPEAVPQHLQAALTAAPAAAAAAASQDQLCARAAAGSTFAGEQAGTGMLQVQPGNQQQSPGAVTTAAAVAGQANSFRRFKNLPHPATAQQQQQQQKPLGVQEQPGGSRVAAVAEAGSPGVAGGSAAAAAEAGTAANRQEGRAPGWEPCPASRLCDPVMQQEPSSSQEGEVQQGSKHGSAEQAQQEQQQQEEQSEEGEGIECSDAGCSFDHPAAPSCWRLQMAAVFDLQARLDQLAAAEQGVRERSAAVVNPQGGESAVNTLLQFMGQTRQQLLLLQLASAEQHKQQIRRCVAGAVQHIPCPAVHEQLQLLLDVQQRQQQQQGGNAGQACSTSSAAAAVDSEAGSLFLAVALLALFLPCDLHGCASEWQCSGADRVLLLWGEGPLADCLAALQAAVVVPPAAAPAAAVDAVRTAEGPPPAAAAGQGGKPASSSSSLWDWDALTADRVGCLVGLLRVQLSLDLNGPFSVNMMGMLDAFQHLFAAQQTAAGAAAAAAAAADDSDVVPEADSVQGLRHRRELLVQLLCRTAQVAEYTWLPAAAAAAAAAASAAATAGDGDAGSVSGAEGCVWLGTAADTGRVPAAVSDAWVRVQSAARAIPQPPAAAAAGLPQSEQSPPCGQAQPPFWRSFTAEAVREEGSLLRRGYSISKVVLDTALASSSSSCWYLGPPWPLGRPFMYMWHMAASALADPGSTKGDLEAVQADFDAFLRYTDAVGRMFPGQLSRPLLWRQMTVQGPGGHSVLAYRGATKRMADAAECDAQCMSELGPNAAASAAGGPAAAVAAGGCGGLAAGQGSQVDHVFLMLYSLLALRVICGRVYGQLTHDELSSWGHGPGSCGGSDGDKQGRCHHHQQQQRRIPHPAADRLRCQGLKLVAEAETALTLSVRARLRAAAAAAAAGSPSPTAAAAAAGLPQFAEYTAKLVLCLGSVCDLLLLEDGELLLQHPYVVPGGGALKPFVEGYMGRAEGFMLEGQYDQAYAELYSLCGWLERRQVVVEPGSVPPGFTQP